MSPERKLVVAISRASRPPPDEDPVEWVERTVAQVNSARASRVDFDQTPWFRKIFRNFCDGEIREINVVAPVGSGKTTLIESAVSFAVARDPGPMLIAVQSESEAKIWAQTRLHPILRKNPEISPIFPTEATKAKQLQILFPHMPLFLGGANLNTLQSKSCRYVVIDEAWIWRDGMLEEARKRTHDRWNSKILRVSQGGVQDDDWQQMCRMGAQYRFETRCRKCGSIRLYGRDDLRFEVVRTDPKDDTSPVDWPKTFETVRIECPGCGERYLDDPHDRREFLDSSEWVLTDPNGVPGYITCHYNALVVPWIRLRDLVREYVSAKDAWEEGDPTPYRQFVQKRFGEFWVEEEVYAEESSIGGDNYSLADYAGGESIPDERARFMAVDVQAHYFWAVIRAYGVGQSMLLYADEVPSEDELRRLATRYGVPNSHVFVDCAYDTPRVLSMCARNKWIGLNSTKQRSYRHKERGRVVEKIWSPLKRQKTPSGLAAYYTFSAESAKDIMGHLRSGKAPGFKIAADVGDVYRRHMVCEAKKKIYNKKTRKTEYRWVQTGRRADLWDCETMCLVGAMLHRVV